MMFKASPAAMRHASARNSRRSAVKVEAINRKEVLITGGNTGIGYEAALVLLRKGYNVTLACRDPTRAGNAQKLLRELVPGSSVEVEIVDLADLESVRDCAAKLLDKGTVFDVVLNNAGVMATPKMETKQGHEFQFGVNHLGHFLLTKELMPSLTEANKPVRIINVASSAHMFGRMDFNDLNRDKNYQPWDAYGQSKLANVLYTFEMDRMMKDNTNITANCLHPGVVRTELGRYMLEGTNNQLIIAAGVALANIFLKSPQQGAETSIYLASSPDVEGKSGKYYSDCRVTPTSPAATDKKVARKLWEVSEELTEKKVPAKAMA